MTKPRLFTNAMYFAWLLRGEIREKLLQECESEEEALKEFVVWWLLFGRNEYPEHEECTEIQAAVAGEVVETFEEFEITRLMRLLLKVRDDVQRDIETTEGWPGLIRWYYVFGVPEYRLFDVLSDGEWDYVNAPAQDIPQDTSLPLNQLMYWVWLSRSDVGAAFPLTDAENRERFVAWFYVYGLKEQRLFGYVGAAEAARLCQPLPGFGNDATLPMTRLMWYLRIADPEVQRRPDVNTESGLPALRKIAQDRLMPFGELRPLWDILNSRYWRYFRVEKATPALPSLKTRRPRDFRKCLGGDTPGVNLVGYAMGELGIGEDVRMMARALETAGIEFCVLNRHPGPEIRQMDFSGVDYLSARPRYPVTVICMTAFDTVSLWLDCPRLFETTYVIGYWPWELPLWPEEWAGVYELVDEIWSSSRYTGRAFAADVSAPVNVMPMAVTVDATVPRDRAYFGLPEGRFLFLFVFDFMSYLARKNPEACILAFRHAFPEGTEPVNLVLKISNVIPDHPQWKAFRKKCAADGRILIIEGTSSRADVLALMEVCDAYVSLHRAEGFGRTLAEAMLLKKPVIATDYSGNTDFLNDETGYPVDFKLVTVKKGEYPHAKGMKWADPDWEMAGEQMARVFFDREESTQRAEEGYRLVSTVYALDQVGSRYRDRLEALRKERGTAR